MGLERDFFDLIKNPIIYNLSGQILEMYWEIKKTSELSNLWMARCLNIIGSELEGVEIEIQLFWSLL